MVLKSRFIIVLLFLNILHSQNNFENGTSPSIYRHFQEHQIMPGYNQFMVQVEGGDFLNFFGKRLVDITDDNREDIIIRIYEHMEGEWDFSSVPMRPFIHLNFDNDLIPSLNVDTLHIYGNQNLIYHVNGNGEKFYYNFQPDDPSVANYFGVEDYRSYLSRHGFEEGDDYWVGNSIGGYYNSDEIEYTPRVMKTFQNRLYDVTNEMFQFDQFLENSNEKYSWDYVVGVGDYDNDGDNDILMVGNGCIGNNDDFSHCDDRVRYSRDLFYFMENQGDGTLISSVYDYIPSDGYQWSNEFQGISLVMNFDTDNSDELLMVMKFNDDNNQPLPNRQKLGYINVDKNSRTVDFVELLDADEFLENPSWSINPDYFKSMNFESYPGREFILMFFSSEGGSPVTNFSGETDFTLGVPQQYFKVFEKIFSENQTQLVDKTSMFFDLDESRTLSLDDNGDTYFIDIDGDGDMDIFPQQYFGIRPNQGGLTQFMSYPNWRYDPNQIYYFENIGDRYQLSTWNSIYHMFISNFDSTTDFNRFNDNGQILNINGEINIDEVFVGNRVSLNDLDKDGEYEFITASTPNYLSIMTKSNVSSNSNVFDLGFDYLEMNPDNQETNGLSIKYAHQENDFYPSVDSLNINFDPSYDIKFVIKDPNQLLTHQPIESGVLLSENNQGKVLYKKYPSHNPQSPLDSPREKHSLYYYNLHENPHLNDQNREISFPIKLRVNNDYYHKVIPMKIKNENVKPYPFKLISENRETTGRVELSFYSSFDYNLNSHEGNSNYTVKFKPDGGQADVINYTQNRIPGPKYGYRIFDVDNNVIQEVINVGYTIKLTPSGGDNISIIENFVINVPQNQNVTYEVFALDTQNPSVETLMTNCINDKDYDGVVDCKDVYPSDPYSTSNDIDGNRIFNLPNNNYTISLENLSCIGENDGSISISVEDEDLNYTLRLNGENPTTLNSFQGYQQTLSNLSPGTYQLCFTVEGESGYNQCFDVNITEPAPLSASSRVDKENKTIRFNLSGSEQYTINHNGTDYVFGSSTPEIDLVYGLNFIEVKTDKYCQGTYTKEVFISEKVEYYPNPTRDFVNLYLHGQDSSIDLQIVDRDGNIKEILCKGIGLNRKIKIDFSSYPEGVYMIRLLSKTIDKTVKIIKE